MRVLHVIPSLSPKHGGTSSAVLLMAGSLVNAGLKVDVATTDDDGAGCHFSHLTGQRREQTGCGIYYFRKQTEFYKVSLPFRKWIAGHMSDYDLVHIHVVFSYTSNSAARFAQKLGVPYLISPHGVLNGWGMKNRRRLVKAVSFRLVEQPILRHAAAMHYTSQTERREAEQVGATAPSSVIPLGIDASVFQNLPDADVFLNRFPQARGRKLVLFLSRLDAKKGLDLLIKAWAAVQKTEVGRQKSEGSGQRTEGTSPRPSPQGGEGEAKIGNPKSGDWLLVIAGSGEAGYEHTLRSQAERLGVGANILWTGFLAGKEKLSALAAASVFVLPSYSENFGIALIEAMAAGLPCLTTTGVALASDVQARADHVLRVVPAEVRPLAIALEQLFGDASLRAQLGNNARRMAVEHYSLPAMGAALEQLYKSILGRQ